MKNETSQSTVMITIRPMRETDIEPIAVDRCLPWSTPQESKDKWNSYYREQQTAIRTVGIVEQNGNILGYEPIRKLLENFRFSESKKQ
jgi:hypothetical protein